MHATHDDPVADALRSLREAALASATARNEQYRIGSADIHFCANAIAEHHKLDAALVVNGLSTAPLDILAHIDTPDGLAALGMLFAENLGGDASAPLAISIH